MEAGVDKTWLHRYRLEKSFKSFERWLEIWMLKKINNRFFFAQPGISIVDPANAEIIFLL